MKGYKHLTEFDRNKIARMRKEGATMREIGAALHVSAATVCREIKRGTYTYMNADYIEVTEYIPERSQARYRANMAAKGGPLKIGSDRRYAETLEALIADDNYSPEAALHEIENHPEKYGSFETRICRQTLYAYIDKGVFLRLTNKALPFKGSRRKKKTKHVQRAPSMWRWMRLTIISSAMRFLPPSGTMMLAFFLLGSTDCLIPGLSRCRFREYAKQKSGKTENRKSYCNRFTLRIQPLTS